MTREQAKAELLTREPDFLPLAKRTVNKHPTYICPNPNCTNGTGKEGTGIAIDVKSGFFHLHWKCFQCGLYEDIVGLWKLHTGISSNAEAFKELYSYYSIPVDEYSDSYQAERKPRNSMKQNSSATVPEQEPDYTNFFLQANQNLVNTDYHRGLTLDTLNRFKIGYVGSWRHPKAPARVPTSPRLIIPTSKHSYLARDTRDKLTAVQKKYSKSKVGAVRIFNLEALQTADKPVFVVEGEIDALSIIDVGGEAIALGSTSNVHKFLETLSKKKPEQPLIISLDNDTAGKKAVKELSEGLERLGVPYYLFDIAEPYKDANEALNADRDTLTGKVEEIQNDPDEAIRMAQETEYMQTAVLSHLQEFVNGIADSVNTPQDSVL